MRAWSAPDAFPARRWLCLRPARRSAGIGGSGLCKLRKDRGIFPALKSSPAPEQHHGAQPRQLARQPILCRPGAALGAFPASRRCFLPSDRFSAVRRPGLRGEDLDSRDLTWGTSGRMTAREDAAPARSSLTARRMPRRGQFRGRGRRVLAPAGGAGAGADEHGAGVPGHGDARKRPREGLLVHMWMGEGPGVDHGAIGQFHPPAVGVIVPAGIAVFQCDRDAPAAARRPPPRRRRCGPGRPWPGRREGSGETGRIRCRMGEGWHGGPACHLTLA